MGIKDLPKGSRRKEVRNIYGDPLPLDKKLKYNKKDIYSILKRELRFNEEGKCVNAFRVLSNPGILKLAYESIKSKSGNMTHGTDKETLDGISKA